MSERQDEVFALLSRGTTFGVDRVDIIETHASAVFLAGDRAYKLKKAVRYSYLDYSTCELRRINCQAEVAINSRFAPALYICVVAVTRESDGSLALAGNGSPVDWLVVMRRFEQDSQFDRMAERGTLNAELMRRLADRIAAAHDQAQTRVDRGGVAGLRQAIDITVDNLRLAVPVALPRDRTELWIERAVASLDRWTELLEQRRRDGHVRQCHGDLHLRNICLLDGEPILFDAIEFDESLSTTDVLYDLAFLLMDLGNRGLGNLANLVFNRYFDRRVETGGLPVLPLFLSVRAAIRAQVTAAADAHRHGTAPADLRSDARRYLDLALKLLEPPPPRLIAVGGFSGSGKSTLSYALAPNIGAVPGARVLRTDILRKRAAGVAPEVSLPAEFYTPERHEETYRALVKEARSCLRGGQAVIVDAVFGQASERAAIEAVAREVGVPFAAIWLAAAGNVLEDRVGLRQTDASDATAEVVRNQIASGEPPRNWLWVDAEGDPQSVLVGARAGLELDA